MRKLILLRLFLFSLILTSFLSLSTSAQSRKTIGFKKVTYGPAVSIVRSVSEAKVNSSGIHYVIVNLTVNRGSLSGKAILEEDMSTSLTGTEINSAGAKFSYKKGVVKFTWKKLPDDKTISLSYQLTALNQVADAQIVTGEFDTKDRSVMINPTDFTMKLVVKDTTKNKVAPIKRDTIISTSILKKPDSSGVAKVITPPAHTDSIPTPAKKPKTSIHAKHESTASNHHTKKSDTASVAKSIPVINTDTAKHIQPPVNNNDFAIKPIDRAHDSLRLAELTNSHPRYDTTPKQPKRTKTTKHTTPQTKKSDTTSVAKSIPLIKTDTAKHIQQPVTHDDFVLKPIDRAHDSLRLAEVTNRHVRYDTTSKHTKRTKTTTHSSHQTKMSDSLSVVKIIPVVHSDSSVITSNKTKSDTSNVYYRIQIGAFENQSKLHNLLVRYKIKEKPFMEETNNSTTRYLIGKYDDLSAAKARIEELNDMGLTGTFVVPYYKAKRITMQEAKQLQGASNKVN